MRLYLSRLGIADQKKTEAAVRKKYRYQEVKISGKKYHKHRIIAEEILQRKLADGEVVHHIDGNPSNNDTSNLVVLKSASHHRAIHRKRPDKKLKHPDEKNEEIRCACGCGGTLLKYDHVNRPRKFINGHRASKRNPENGELRWCHYCKKWDHYSVMTKRTNRKAFYHRECHNKYTRDLFQKSREVRHAVRS